LKRQRSECPAPGAAERCTEVCGVGVLLSVQRDDHVNEVGVASIGVLPQMTTHLARVVSTFGTHLARVAGKHEEQDGQGRQEQLGGSVSAHSAWLHSLELGAQRTCHEFEQGRNADANLETARMQQLAAGTAISDRR
jgi:hypothetical protein